MNKIAVLAIGDNGENEPLPFNGRKLGLAEPRKHVKRFPSSVIAWGLWPQIDDYSQMTTQELESPVGCNSGNLVFVNAIARQMKIKKGPTWSTAINTEGTAVIPCANQLGKHADMGYMAGKINESNCRVVALGLGAQAPTFDDIPEIPAGTLRWLKAIVEKAPNPDHPNITLRGPFTQKIMEHYGFGNAGVVLGCPSLFTNSDKNLGKKIAANFRKPKRVAVAAGNYHLARLDKLEQSLAKIVEETHGIYIVQNPVGMRKVGRGEYDEMTAPEKNLFHNYVLPNYSEEEEREWLHKYPRVFYNVDAWIEELRHVDFVIGPRIHGVLLGLQAGVPSVCMAVDSRTRELCETMKVPYISAYDYQEGIKLEELERTFNFDPEEFDKNRHSLAQKYVAFLERNYLAPKDWLKKL